VVAIACGVLVEPAASKLPQLRFEQRRADAGSTVKAAVPIWPSLELDKLRFYLVHERDLAAMFSPYEWMLFRAAAQAAAKDKRFIELDVPATDGSVARTGPVPVQITLPHDLRPGQYTTAVLLCAPTCVLELALTSRRMAILRSISKWNQGFALRVD